MTTRSISPFVTISMNSVKLSGRRGPAVVHRLEEEEDDDQDHHPEEYVLYGRAQKVTLPGNLRRRAAPRSVNGAAHHVQPRTTLIGPVACAKGESPGVRTFAMNGKLPPSPANSIP